MDAVGTRIKGEFTLVPAVQIRIVSAIPILSPHEGAVDFKRPPVVEGLCVPDGSFIHGLDIFGFLLVAPNMVESLPVVGADPLVFKRTFTPNQKHSVEGIGTI